MAFSKPKRFVIEPVAIFLTTTSSGIIFTSLTNCSVSESCLIKWLSMPCLFKYSKIIEVIRLFKRPFLASYPFWRRYLL